MMFCGASVWTFENLNSKEQRFRAKHYCIEFAQHGLFGVKSRVHFSCVVMIWGFVKGTDRTSWYGKTKFEIDKDWVFIPLGCTFSLMCVIIWTVTMVFLRNLKWDWDLTSGGANPIEKTKKERPKQTSLRLVLSDSTIPRVLSPSGHWNT